MNVLERWVEEEITRVPRGPSADELRRRVRTRRARRAGSLAIVAIVFAVLGVVAAVRSPAPHRVTVRGPVPTPTTLPLATTREVPPLAKIVNSVVEKVHTDIALKAVAHAPSSAQIVMTMNGHGGASTHPGPIYHVQVIGDFVCNDCLGHTSFRAHGPVMQMDFNQAGLIVGFGMGAKRPVDLSALGTVFRMSLTRPLATTSKFPALVKMAEIVSNAVRSDDRPVPGAGHPTTAEIVETTRAQAFPLFGGSTPNLGSPIYAVQVIGNFICDGCSVPPGAAAPRGRALHIVFDDGGHGYVFGVGPAVYDLSTLGTVYRLPLP